MTHVTLHHEGWLPEVVEYSLARVRPPHFTPNKKSRENFRKRIPVSLPGLN